MTNNTNTAPSRSSSKQYIVLVSMMTFILPVAGFFTEHLVRGIDMSFFLFCKWFIFFAVGLRLFLAGIKQTLQPAFTAQRIFHIEGEEAFPIVRELGFANLCFGVVGLLTVFLPEWRVVSAFASGLYYGLAGLQHLIKKQAGANEKFALWTDLAIFAILAIYVFLHFSR